VRAATHALAGGGASAQEDALATLQHLLDCPLLREVSIKVSRLKSLATFAIEAAASEGDHSRADAAASAV
jgi:hypothetical protein